MDIDALHSALISLTLVSEEIHSTRETLTFATPSQRAGLVQFLGSIEGDLRLAKAALAQELGFPLCDCCWPPQLLVTDSNGKTQCATRLEEADAVASQAVRPARAVALQIPSRRPIAEYAAHARL